MPEGDERDEEIVTLRMENSWLRTRVADLELQNETLLWERVEARKKLASAERLIDLLTEPDDTRGASLNAGP